MSSSGWCSRNGKRLRPQLACNGLLASPDFCAIPMRVGVRKSTRAPVLKGLRIAALCVAIFTSVAQSDPLDVWRRRLSPGPPVTITGIAYGNGILVAAGNNGGLLVSPDGITWTQYFSLPVIGQGGVIYGAGAFYAYGYSLSGGGNFILESADGVTGAKIYETIGTIKSAAYGNNRVVFVATDRIITTTVAPTNWTESQLPQNTPLSGVNYGMGRFGYRCGTTDVPYRSLNESCAGVDLAATH